MSEALVPPHAEEPCRAGRLEARTRLAVVAISGALALCGCISVLPRSPPVQLYTFGERPPPAVSPAPTMPSTRVAVVLTGVALPRAAAGDQILTLTGHEAAYVAGARWVTPAVLMFQADAERALQAGTRRVRLLARSDYGAAQTLLRLEVDDFETRYDQGRDAAPTVLVSMRATLSRPGGEPLTDQTFTAREPAAANRVAAIVEAYDRSTLRVLDQAAAWTDTQAATAMPAPGGATTTTTDAQSQTVRR